MSTSFTRLERSKNHTSCHISIMCLIDTVLKRLGVQQVIPLVEVFKWKMATSSEGCLCIWPICYMLLCLRSFVESIAPTSLPANLWPAIQVIYREGIFVQNKFLKCNQILQRSYQLIIALSRHPQIFTIHRFQQLKQGEKTDKNVNPSPDPYVPFSPNVWTHTFSGQRSCICFHFTLTNTSITLQIFYSKKNCRQKLLL